MSENTHTYDVHMYRAFNFVDVMVEPYVVFDSVIFSISSISSVESVTIDMNQHTSY